jgi:uncharacterized membrane-anchored protein YhcB (DUF1043 family)
MMIDWNGVILILVIAVVIIGMVIARVKQARAPKPESETDELLVRMREAFDRREEL